MIYIKALAKFICLPVVHRFLYQEEYFTIHFQRRQRVVPKIAMEDSPDNSKALSEKLGKKLLATVSKPNEDVDKCKRLLKQGANINYMKKDEDLSLFERSQYDEGNPATPFSVALDRGHYNIVKLFLKNGIDIDQRNGYGLTELMLRACMHDKKGLKFLLDNGADVDASIPDGRKAIQSVFSAMSDQEGDDEGIEILKILIANGADVNSKANDGVSLLHLVALEGRTKVAKFLVRNGADVNIKDEAGITPIFGAVMKKDLRMMKTLLDLGANINIQQDVGVTALMAAARLRSLKMIKLLLELGADPNIKCHQGYTAMMQPYVCADAINRKNFNFFQTFIDAGADLNVESDEGESIVVMAARTRQIKEVIQLMEAGADVNATDKEGNSLLMILMKEFILPHNRWLYLAASSYLSDGKLNTSQCNFISKKDFFITAKKLVDAGLDLDIQNDCGQTALMLSINNEDSNNDNYIEGLAEEIIKAGADLHLEDIFGNNALVYAAKAEMIDDMGLANLMMSLANFENKTYKKVYCRITTAMNNMRRW